MSTSSDIRTNEVSKFKAKVSQEIAEGVSASLAVGTPHNYNFKLHSDFKDQFRNSALNLTLLRLSASLGCNVAEKSYPDVFTA